MANTQGIDFGQSSKIEYSLSSLTTPVENNSNIARDAAQAIQVGSNLGKVIQGEKDEADQANYFNSVIDFNNYRSDQQKELFDAGMDLNKQREVLDKYNSIYNMLPNKHGLDEKYSAQLGTSIEGHVSGLEEKYRSVYNARRADEAEANMAEVSSTLTTVPKEDAATTLKALKEYYKLETGADDRTAGVKVSKQYINAKIASVDPESMTFEQAKDFKKDLKDVLTTADSKITTDINYRETIQATDKIIEVKRREEEGKLQDLIKIGQVPTNTMNKMIDDYRKRGIVTTDEQTMLYKETYKNILLEKEARAEALTYRLDSKAAQKAEWAILANKFDSVSELQQVLNTSPEFKNLLQEHKDAIVGHFQTTFNKEKNKALQAQDKELLGFLQANKTNIAPDGTEVSPQEYTRMHRNISSDGSLNAEAQKDIATHVLIGTASKNPEMFAATPLYAYPSAGVDSAKEVANTQMDKAFQENRMDIVSAINSNYGVKGNISTYFSGALENPSNFKDTYQRYLQVKQAMPASYKEVIGKDTALKLEAINRISTLTGGQITTDVYQKAEEIIKQEVFLQPEQRKKISSSIADNKISDINGFNESIIDFMRVGKTFSEASELAKKEFATNVVGNINLTGIPNVTLNSKQKDLLKTGMDEIIAKKDSNINGALYNKATNTIWVSTKGNMYARDSKMNFDQFMGFLSEELAKRPKAKVDISNNIKDAKAGTYD